jgi:hypothetical protein
VQATRAKANEAREKLRDKPAAKATSEKTPSSRKTAPASPPSLDNGVAPAPGPKRGVQGRTDPLAAKLVAAKSGSAAPAKAAKETREVSAGPRGGKFVQGPEGTKHYVK